MKPSWFMKVPWWNLHESWRFHDGTFMKPSWSWRFHDAAFMKVSWDLHEAIPSDIRTILYNENNKNRWSSWTFHEGFMKVSWYHGFMKVSWRFHEGFMMKNLHETFMKIRGVTPARYWPGLINRADLGKNPPPRFVAPGLIRAGSRFRSKDSAGRLQMRSAP